VQFASFTVNDDFVAWWWTNSSLTDAGGRAAAWAPPRTPFPRCLATARDNATADDRTTLTRSVESLIERPFDGHLARARHDDSRLVGHEALGDLAVGQPLGDEPQDLGLS
jgi:hypothetical protein